MITNMIHHPRTRTSNIKLQYFKSEIGVLYSNENRHTAITIELTRQFNVTKAFETAKKLYT